ncbi:unnamed protein product [Parascedosporium putredinis]|uniref:Uncharacterized protein n=2 Tax=Parascedosporium putredinis TaxID=1442378 RepID=A0A9P1M5X4_9PEZI|nr:unnamed protein product [Parascedosporium putredinis]CAI7988616.1 unnamed protein product [Parascedosporium putredinis]
MIAYMFSYTRFFGSMGEDGDDPWLWGPQRLAQELCSTEQPWYPRDKPERFVSFEVLSKNLEKHDVDGELLLTGTGQPLRDLLRDLGADSHQKSNRLHTAIKFLKGRSVAFQRWEASASRPLPSAGPGPLPESTANIPAKPAAAEPVSKSVTNSVANPAAQELKHQAAKRRFEDISMSDGEDCVFLALPESEEPLPPKKKKGKEKKKKKKKRLAPAQLTAVPAFLLPSRSAFSVPTEADIITRPLEPMKPNDGLMTLSTGAVVGFLGITKSPWTEALDPGFSESDSDDSPERTFQVLETERAPGRSLHVNRGMRALLLRQYSRIGHLLTNKFDTAPEPDSFLANQLRRVHSKEYGSSHLADEELFGSLEDDDDEQFDPQTLREIEEEEEEMARMKQQAATLTLSQDVVNRTKAYSLWMEARRVGSSIRLNAAHEKLRGLEVRLAKLRETILDYTWTSERRVRQQGACLEQTIEDKQEVAFRIKLFSSGEPPQKPNLIRPAKPIRRRRERSASLDPLEEELTSDDDEPVPASVPWMTRRNGMRERDVKDATTRMQISTAQIVIGDEHRRAASSSHTPMDLDTDSDEDEVVNNLTPALKSDSKLDDTSKARNKATSLSDEFWLQTLSALITRLFISWYEVGPFRIAELTAARQHPEKVEAQRHRLGAFINLIVQVVPRFPKIMAVDELGGRIQVAMDAQAMRVRQMEQERRDKIEERRHELRRKLASDVPVVGDRSRLIINESKEESDGFIHIGGVPASHIKNHQVEGVRFLWNQIVVPPEQRHGCLLAHTMGLGKTMQVISLLLSILDAANSSDPSVRSQIPEDLRASRTVVVCPSSLALNWRDEILLWDSEKALGDIYILGGTTMSHMDTRMLRESTVEKWSFGGGVLIIGYTLLARLFTAHPSLIGLIHQSAAIVVADEAHNIKTLTTQMRKACVPFKTRARIALTGSPLANNVREYFSMIDWVAPNYLGGYKEFEVRYTTVIQKGLWRNSSPEEKWAARAALKKLSTEIAPKVHRMDMSVLRGELPEKKEFVMFIPPTDLQRLLYDAFTSMLDTQRDTWGAISYLALICAHPQCFIDKAKAVLNGTDGNSDPGSDNEEAEGSSRVIRDQNADIRERRPVMTRNIAQAMIDLASTEDDLSSIDHSWRFKHLMVILEEARAAGEKTIIFSRRIRALTLLEMYLRQRGRRWSRLDGTTPMKDRLPMIKDFNSNKEVDLFLISTKAGGVGLNIYGANRVVILDYEHNPVWEQQAIGRAYRIGQTKPVFVYWFVMWGAHEWKIHNRSVFKNQLAHRVVDNRHNIQSWSQDESASWIRPLWDLDGEVDIRIRTEDGEERTVSVRLTVPKSEAKAIAGKDRIMDRLLGDQETSSQILTVITSDVFEEEDPSLKRRWSVWFYYLVPTFKQYMGRVPWESFAPITESLMSGAPGTMAYWLSEAITVENLPRAYERLTDAVIRLSEPRVLTAFLRALIEPHIFFDASAQFLEAAIASAIDSPLSPLAPMDNLIRPYPVLPAPQVNAERQPAQVGQAPCSGRLLPLTSRKRTPHLPPGFGIQTIYRSSSPTETATISETELYPGGSSRPHFNSIRRSSSRGRKSDMRGSMRNPSTPVGQRCDTIQWRYAAEPRKLGSDSDDLHAIPAAGET